MKTRELKAPAGQLLTCKQLMSANVDYVCNLNMAEDEESISIPGHIDLGRHPPSQYHHESCPNLLMRNGYRYNDS